MKKKNNGLLVWAVVVLITLTSCLKNIDLDLEGWGAGSGGLSYYSQYAINIYDTGFEPDTITVKIGTTVSWTNWDYNRDHSVISDDGTSFKSDTIAPYAFYEYTTNKEGSYNYHCRHGEKGVLIVTP